jgi:hypothetical protein
LHYPTAFQESDTRLGKMSRKYISIVDLWSHSDYRHDSDSYWNRLIEMCSSRVQQRLKFTFDLFFQAAAIQTNYRINGVIPDLESYITLRRDTGGCKFFLALIEYANNLTVPDEVMEHPVIQSLNQSVNDFVNWSNVSCLHPVDFQSLNFVLGRVFL